MSGERAYQHVLAGSNIVVVDGMCREAEAIHDRLVLAAEPVESVAYDFGLSARAVRLIAGGYAQGKRSATTQNPNQEDKGQ